MKTFQVLRSLMLLGVAVVNGQEEIGNDNVQFRLNNQAEVCFGGSKRSRKMLSQRSQHG
jgi:hypothetical protein